jgi:hypothetical protein
MGRKQRFREEKREIKNNPPPSAAVITYCYCSKVCQTAHWEKTNHRSECKQLQILNKYHKPYAKDIRDAVIRGETDIYALEKLRYKLGLTRTGTNNDCKR